MLSLGRSREERFLRGGSRRFPAAGWVVVATAGVLGLAALASEPEAAVEIKTVVVPTPPPPVTIADTLASGQTLAEILADHSFTPLGVHSLVEAIREFRSPRSLQPGVVVEFTGRPNTVPGLLLVELDADSRLSLTASDSGWLARLDSVPVTVDTIRLAGLIESTLWEAELLGDTAALDMETFAEIIWGLSSQVYAWQVDFSRDIRVGDAFRVVMEREVRPDGSIRSFHFLVTEFRNAERTLTAIPFLRPDGHREYYDPEGESLRGVFLRAPVEFRITSGFSRRRYHPVLHRTRAHLGIDYGASYGSPVQATGDGKVTRAGRWGGFGRIVELRHGGGIRTRYAHLSRIAVSVGEWVQQGEIVGYVGSSGLATGPHLHYEFLKNGSQTDPAKVDLPPAPALEDEYRDEFAVVRGKALALLESVPLPGPSAPEMPAGKVAAATE